MAGGTRCRQLPITMVGIITLALLPAITVVEAEVVPEAAKENQPQDFYCEQYNRTECSQKDPTLTNCTAKTIKKCEALEHPEKSHQCFVLWTNTSGKIEVDLKGCWLDDKTCTDTDDCISRQSVSSLTEQKPHLFCCCNNQQCNKNFYWHPAPEVPTTTAAPSEASDVVVETVAWTLGTLVVVVIVITILFYLYRRHRMANFMELPRVESTALVPPSPPMGLRPIQLREIKARGRFGAVWKANLHGDVVAVKIFPVQDKQSWSVEKEVYSLPQMSHDNILHFIGAEKRGENLQAEFWLITTYHERGSLNDYLKANLVTWNELCTIGESMARGLMYLHEEQPATKCEDLKPAIAHRDFKSKNVLLKNDLTACIADFGLALIFRPGQSPGDTHGQVGTRRYMAPEVLEGAINFQRDAFLRIDMYACGLVLWEMLSRCSSQDGPIAEYHLPFEDEVGQHPTLDDMQECVVTQKARPAIQPSWRTNVAMVGLIDTMEECWDHDAEARLSASCVVERLSSLSSNPQFSPTSHPQKESSI